MKHLPQIAQHLIDAGRDPGESVAIVSEASLPTQRVVETTLATAHQAAQEVELSPPAIVCVGRVVQLRSMLNWFGTPTEGDGFGPFADANPVGPAAQESPPRKVGQAV